MASDASTRSAPDAVRFPQDFVDNIPIYQNAIRGHRTARWARDRGLEDDLVQLSLLDLARVDSRFDPTRGTSPHHYRMAVLGSRVSDCFDHLQRTHGDVVEYDDDRDDAEGSPDGDQMDHEAHETAGHDLVFADASCAEFVRALVAIVEALPSVQRKVIELALADHSDREIANALGVSIQAVNVARRKGLAKIQAALRSGNYLN
jgi:RNA polymerase sigma factor (sigma-70 family)